SGLVQRAVMSAVALLATAVLARLAHWRGMGEIWGAWAGCGLLIAGIAGNGVSPLIWSGGVPDFIHLGNWIWNVADFEISVGLVGGVASIVVTGFGAWIRERRIPASDFSTSISEPAQ